MILDQKRHKGPISQRNRIAFAFMELARDKTFQKVSSEKKLELIQNALDVGDQVAVWIHSEHNTRDPRKIAERLGLKVFGEDKGMVAGKVKRSEYRHESREIVIFRDTLERLMSEVDSKELSERLLRLLVAHELFHHLERTQVGEVSKKFMITAWKFGPFERKREIKKLSDVSAHAFTQSLLELDFSPLVFDYLTYTLYTDLK
ncbi:MAG: metallopeptidase family protein [Candidatus Margulisbacteria bacterium]|nr:metallopeptidase family protein [Candidatus Margulisiibacteriota bacterium]MBU1021387.1 metallopeptidase family protein [Candidatus Margulisiibacteriota bacterium]MBU1729124.1 metallopeptidase family protein [Candidatus Margulisiibacteriota bacterium]MBU1954797.1 metallopeptidase family protein [Candidatus Margulisiibacteriota bacterium]